MARNPDFYYTLRKLGCLFAPSNFRVNDFGKVVTLVGTVALERSLMGMSTVVLGHIWFKNMWGIFDLNSNSINTYDNNEIIFQAKQFLKNKLNFCTINNAIGVGTGTKSPNSNDWVEHRKEFQNLITSLTKIEWEYHQ
jgi:hypothetical protein